MVMREIFPGGSTGAVVLSNRAPLPIAEIRTPTAPMGFARPCFLQPFLFLCHLLFYPLEFSAAGDSSDGAYAPAGAPLRMKITSQTVGI